MLGVVLFNIFATPVFAALPTVETDNAEPVTDTQATLHGEITATGGAANDFRGFVWDISQFPNPGNVAPAISGYANNWTTAGAFGVGTFNHTITGLATQTHYYYRACSHHPVDGWSYGEEISFFTYGVDKKYLELRPQLDEADIAGHGSPTLATVGVFKGFSLPIWDGGGNNNEELYFIICVTDRWDGESDILIHINCALANAGESGNSYQWDINWEKFTPGEDVVPAAFISMSQRRNVDSNLQYQSYRDWFALDYDIIATDPVEPDDLLALRLRRGDVVPFQLKNLNGELIVLSVDFLFARGDAMGDPLGAVSEGDVYLLALILLPLALLAIAYGFKKIVFAIGAAGGWILLGIYAYTLSTTTWDVYYFFFWIAIGLAIVSILEAMVIRNREPVGQDIGKIEPETSFDRNLAKLTAQQKQMARYRRAMSGKTEEEEEDERNSRKNKRLG